MRPLSFSDIIYPWRRVRELYRELAMATLRLAAVESENTDLKARLLRIKKETDLGTPYKS